MSKLTWSGSSVAHNTSHASRRSMLTQGPKSAESLLVDVEVSPGDCVGGGRTGISEACGVEQHPLKRLSPCRGTFGSCSHRRIAADMERPAGGPTRRAILPQNKSDTAAMCSKLADGSLPPIIGLLWSSQISVEASAASFRAIYSVGATISPVLCQFELPIGAVELMEDAQLQTFSRDSCSMSGSCLMFRKTGVYDEGVFNGTLHLQGAPRPIAFDTSRNLFGLRGGVGLMLSRGT